MTKKLSPAQRRVVEAMMEDFVSIHLYPRSEFIPSSRDWVTLLCNRWQKQQGHPYRKLDLRVFKSLKSKGLLKHYGRPLGEEYIFYTLNRAAAEEVMK